ncbi:MAG: neutral/alkaline non-lysosomal ceramidase N-terminal domain-containing protein [Clostridia bacterium]|nr:neutral/alkaline non-lysosomal ceramidase N-terminal domain-containing protein [Clostridia bacterium]
MDKLYLGVGREIITPEIGGQLCGYSRDIYSEKVEDDLTATAFYFTQGKTRALMVSLTICNMRISLAEEMLSQVEKRYSIPKENCAFSCVHTHSGPNLNGSIAVDDSDFEYRDKIFKPRVFKAIEKALASPQPVKMGEASGDSLVGVNRREITRSGFVKLGQNPWGPFDPRMTVISFINDKNECVANMVHYGCHNTAAGQNHEITRDWCGVMTDALEKITGAPTAFFNGPEGDVGPRLSNGETKGDHAGKLGDISCVYELGGIAARDAADVYRKIYEYKDVRLRAGTRVIKLPLKKKISVKEAEARLKHLTYYYPGEEAWLKRIIKAHEEGEPDARFREVPQRVFALGDLVFATFPMEAFSEIGLRVQKEFTRKKVLCLACTNGTGGYFVTQDAIPRGGYEVETYYKKYVQEYIDGADTELVSQTVDNIEKIAK